MDIAVEDKIRQRAYEIWKSAGKARDPAANWLEAERAVMNETAMPVAKRTTITSMADMASGEPAAPKAAKTGKARTKTASAAKTKAPTASAAKPATRAKRPKTQA